MAIMSKEEARINIKGGLERAPKGEELAMLDLLIAKQKKNGRGSLWFKGILVMNLIMTGVMVYLYSIGQWGIAAAMAMVGVVMWGQFVAMMVMTGKKGTQTNWLEAAEEVRAELVEKSNKAA